MFFGSRLEGAIVSYGLDSELSPTSNNDVMFAGGYSISVVVNRWFWWDGKIPSRLNQAHSFTKANYNYNGYLLRLEMLFS